MKQVKIKNRDAYMLMEYQCEECKKSEVIWNGMGTCRGKRKMGSRASFACRLFTA